ERALSNAARRQPGPTATHPTAATMRGPTARTARTSTDNPSAAIAAIVSQLATSFAASAAASGTNPADRATASTTKPTTNHGTSDESGAVDPRRDRSANSV